MAPAEPATNSRIGAVHYLRSSERVGPNRALYYYGPGTSDSVDSGVIQPSTSDQLVAGGDFVSEYLEAAASHANVAKFVAACQSIDWSAQPAREFVHAIRLALSLDALPLARSLAEIGTRQFSAHEELRKMARILAPPKITKRNLPPEPSVESNAKWLKTHWNDYRGKWIALRDGQLLAVADSAEALAKEIGEIKNTGILVTPIW